ncbi:hypothetical protein SAMN06264849_103143 [Melghirimyces algeriensis]|uniref:Uncharacterized protein n=1 Tax=Melghirimyces algeriensis TaxID=910412 RepID=A0A521C5R9_9BACL|nr:hypothetical protein SAMN06264849_103143 [Melghirimyces algeriensis]
MMWFLFGLLIALVTIIVLISLGVHIIEARRLYPGKIRKRRLR